MYVLIAMFEFHLHLKMQIATFFERHVLMLGICDVQCLFPYVHKSFLWRFFHIPHSYIFHALYRFFPDTVNIWFVFYSCVENWYQFRDIPTLWCFLTLALAIVLEDDFFPSCLEASAMNICGHLVQLCLPHFHLHLKTQIVAFFERYVLMSGIWFNCCKK